MSVYTHLTLSEIQDFAQHYALTVKDIKPVFGGVQNTNYFLFCENGEFVLTVFEDTEKSQIEQLIPILEHLDHHQVKVARPVKAVDGQYIHFIKNKPAQIAPKLQGSEPKASIAQIQAIASEQAKLHRTLQNFSTEINADKDFSLWWQKVIAIVSPDMSADDKHILEQCFNLYHQYKKQYPNCPKGLIHGDLFRDNTLFLDDHLQGILDFAEVHCDEWLYDIAITMNDFCSIADGHIDEDKLQAYLTAYQQVRPMTDDELACLDIYLALMACHFWLFRLNMAKRNRTEQRLNNEVLEKDPNEMREKLVLRLARCTQLLA